MTYKLNTLCSQQPIGRHYITTSTFVLRPEAGMASGDVMCVKRKQGSDLQEDGVLDAASVAVLQLLKGLPHLNHQ